MIYFSSVFISLSVITEVKDAPLVLTVVSPIIHSGLLTGSIVCIAERSRNMDTSIDVLCG